MKELILMSLVLAFVKPVISSNLDSLITKKQEFYIGLSNPFEFTNQSINNNMNLYAVNLPVEMDALLPYYVQSNFFAYGLGYKYHFTNGALRFGADYNSYTNSSTEDESSMSSSQNSIKYGITLMRISFRAGYEFEKNYKRTQIFGGADLTDDYMNASSNYLSSNSAGLNSQSVNGKLNIKCIGLSPFIGIRFILNELISFSVESQIKFYNYSISASGDQSQNNTGYVNSPQHYSITSKGTSFLISPIGLVSMNIHF